MAETNPHDDHQAISGDPEEPHHDNPRSAADADARDAMQLDRLRQNYSRASTRPTALGTASRKPDGIFGRVCDAVSKFWRRQIRVTVPHETSRDHLALERTFLAYLRTSLALSMIGITVAQLFRLQHAPNPNPLFGFYVLGKPLACVCQGAAIYSLLIGAFRTWRSQNAIVRGKAISGGLEIVMLAVGILLILLMFFIILVAIDVDKEFFPKSLPTH